MALLISILSLGATFGAGPPSASMPAPRTVPSVGAIMASPATATGANGTANGNNANNGGGTNQPRVFPPPSYFEHVGMLHDGDYRKALDGLQQDFSFGLQAAGAHWVDSICYLTMAGECQLKMGRPAAALDAYNAALKLNLAFPNWMLGIQFPATLVPQSSVGMTPWGQTARRARAGRFPGTMLIISDTVLMDPIPSPNGGGNMINAGDRSPMDACAR